MDVLSLPEDVQELKQFLLGQLATQKQKIDYQAKRIEFLEAELRLQRQKRFGASSEKHRDLFTADLFSDMVLDIEPPDAEVEESITVPAHQRKRRGHRNQKPMPQMDVVYNLTEEEKVCPHCHEGLTPIKDKTLVQFAIIPQQYYLIRPIRKRYACSCKQCIKTAEMPKQVIPKSEASPQLLAYVMVAKFLDGLPLHRLEKMAAREDMDLPRTKTSRWLISASDFFHRHGR